jgi:mRNA interferase MazF
MPSRPRSMSEVELAPGLVSWANLAPVCGHEQAGHRPVVVVSGSAYLDTVTSLALVVPITSVDRSWSNHVRVDDDAGLPRPSWAMTEQVRAISRDRITAISGLVRPITLAIIRLWIADFLEMEVPGR